MISFNKCRIALVLLILLVSNYAISFCYENRRLSVAEELALSNFVVIATLEASHDISEPDDPEGVAATMYEMNVLTSFSGDSPQKITIRSDNTSSRFIIIPEQKYLLFLRGNSNEAFVDSCGNSGLVGEREKVIDELKSAKHESTQHQGSGL